MFAAVGGLWQKTSVPAADESSCVISGPTSIGVGASQVLDVLRDKQIDPTPLLSRVGLGTDFCRRARISAAAEAQLIEEAARIVDDPTFGLRLAARAESRQWGLTFYILASSSTVREYLRLLPRYVPLVNESTRWSVVSSSDNSAILRLSYVGLLRHCLKHATEYQLAALLQNLREFVDCEFNPVHVSFAHVRTSGIRSFERYFGCPVEFGAKYDQLILSNSSLDMENSRSDRMLCELLQHFGDEEANPRAAPIQSFHQAVDNELFIRLARGEPKLERIAEALGVSARTLIRRLAREGTSFSDLLDNLRRSLACQYLKEPGVSIDQIALLLGYSEVSSFTHAFRRWCGVSPSEAKRACESRCRTPPP